MKHKFINKKTGAEARVIAIYLDSDGVMQVDGYDTVEDLMDDYAAYEEYSPPKEPLIKDERIRKVVRLCADIWGANKILAIKSGSRIEFSDGTPNMRYASFMYAEWQDEIKDRTYYTIEELCGEEEE